MNDPLRNPWRALEHVERKASMGEMRSEVADRMASRLRFLIGQGVTYMPIDYATLLEEATFPPIPKIVYHTSPIAARSAIRMVGLVPCVPDVDGNYVGQRLHQPEGVYVTERPDSEGVWAHGDAWDVWRIQVTQHPRLPDLAWEHDRLNPGNWVITERILPERFGHYFTRSR